MHETVKSPVTGGASVPVEKLDLTWLIDAYQKRYGVDIGRIFEGLSALELYECSDTGYRFFGSRDLSGDAQFYTDLYASSSGEGSKHSDGKWEHLHARELAADVGRVLDVGCGGGYFLSLFSKAQTVGLEIGASGRQHALSRGLDVRNETIETHAAAASSSYDIVTAFQVLEHIHDVKGFLEACLCLLKPDGRLIISVPNNASFIRYSKNFILNMPPHHVGHWTAQSLEALSKFFALEVVRVDFESLAPNHFKWYQTLMEQQYLPENHLVRSLWYRLGGADRLVRFIEENHIDIRGPAVMAVFRINTSRH